ncbi:MFS transporter [Streptomyces sp. CA-132043]|uniref:MFS transporter n=1 Tax=Streptomyces sp. CA-132043 TaxID=3240048 RepID=UPI003D950714
MPNEIPSTARPSRPGLRAAWLLTAAGWGANQFSSLLDAYRHNLGFSAATATGLFALYIVGLLPGLLLGGPVADRVGRKPVVLSAVVAGALGTVALMVGAETSTAALVWLGIGRCLTGLGTGAVLSSGSAWVKELSHAPYEPSAHPTAGAHRASYLLSAGFSASGLVSAVIAQWAPAPMLTAYIPHLLLTVGAVIAALAAPETHQRAPRSERQAAPAPRPARHPRFLRLVVPVAPWVFAGPTIAFGVLPGLVGDRLHGYTTVYAGIATAVTPGCGLLVQPWARRLAARSAERPAVIGMAAVTLGLLIAVPSAAYQQPVPVLIADAFLGAGYGLCVTFGLTEVSHLAGRGQLAGLTATFWAVSYLGFCAPYVFTLLSAIATPTTILLTVATLAALTCATLLLLTRTVPPPTPPHTQPQPQPSKTPATSRG